MKSSVRDAVLILGILSCGAVTAAAAEIENYGAQGALNSGSSWLGGQVPGLADIAVWDGAGAASAGGWQHVLGDYATWRGIRVTLDHPEIFLVQVRAMLKASEGLENLRILQEVLGRTFDLSQVSRALAGGCNHGCLTQQVPEEVKNHLGGSLIVKRSFGWAE